jgi:uncharacterized protein (DUF2147 family)
MKNFTLLVSLFFFLCVQSVFAQKANEIVGVWATEKKDGKIEIFEKNNRYFGKLIWAKDMYDKNGKSVLDVNNQDADLRDRPLENLLLLKNFEFTGDQWENGKIYDPESGKTYNCYIELDGNQLEVTGYVGVKWLSRTVKWTKVSS